MEFGELSDDTASEPPFSGAAQAGPMLSASHDGSSDDGSNDDGGSDGGIDMQAMYERNLASLGDYDLEDDGGDHSLSASGEKCLWDAPRCSCFSIIFESIR
jgi:hypothetical protein